MMIEDGIQNPLVHEFHRDCGNIPWFGYDQIYCWLTQCIIDQINTDIPWHTDICDEVVGEIEQELSKEFLRGDSEEGPDDVGYMRAVDRVVRTISALMMTAAYQEYRDVIAGCIEDYTFTSLTLTKVDYNMGIITLELNQ